MPRSGLLLFMNILQFYFKNIEMLTKSEILRKTVHLSIQSVTELVFDDSLLCSLYFSILERLQTMKAGCLV